MIFEHVRLGRVADDGQDDGGSPRAGLRALAGELAPPDADGLIGYREALALQEHLHERVVAGERGPVLLSLEHPPVYTAGKRAEPSEYPYDGTEVVQTGRGGKLTWHGPGQLVAYPIGLLASPVDTAAFVRDVEQAILDALAGIGVEGVRIEGRSGVWLPADARGPARKIAAIGFRIARGATMHGVAINCDNDLRPYGRIVPCGISDAGVTSLAAEGVRDVGPAQLAGPLHEAFERRIGHRFIAAGAALPAIAGGTR